MSSTAHLPIRTHFACDDLDLFMAVLAALRADPPKRQAGHRCESFDMKGWAYALCTSAKPSTVAKLAEDHTDGLTRGDDETRGLMFTIVAPDDDTAALAALR